TTASAPSSLRWALISSDGARSASAGPWLPSAHASKSSTTCFRASSPRNSPPSRPPAPTRRTTHSRRSELTPPAASSLTPLVPAPVLASLLAVGGLLRAFMLYLFAAAQPRGSGAMAEIAAAIHTGAMAFLRREYSILAAFIVVVAVILSLLTSRYTALAFVAGALCSILPGVLGVKGGAKAKRRTGGGARDASRAEAPA